MNLPLGITLYNQTSIASRWLIWHLFYMSWAWRFGCPSCLRPLLFLVRRALDHRQMVSAASYINLFLYHAAHLLPQRNGCQKWSMRWQALVLSTYCAYSRPWRVLVCAAPESFQRMHYACRASYGSMQNAPKVVVDEARFHHSARIPCPPLLHGPPSSGIRQLW